MSAFGMVRGASIANALDIFWYSAFMVVPRGGIIAVFAYALFGWDFCLAERRTNPFGLRLGVLWAFCAETIGVLYLANVRRCSEMTTTVCGLRFFCFYTFVLRIWNGLAAANVL